MANFAYDPLNFEFLVKHTVVLIFLDCLVSGNQKLQEHGITGLCNFVHEPQIRLQLLEEATLELIQNLLESNCSRILAPALTTLVFLQTENKAAILTTESASRVGELLREVEREEKPARLKNLLITLKEQFEKCD